MQFGTDIHVQMMNPTAFGDLTFHVVPTAGRVTSYHIISFSVHLCLSIFLSPHFLSSILSAL